MQNPSGKLPLNDIRVVILDLDGTMIDSVPDLDVALNGMLQELALPPVEVSAIRMFVGRGTQNLVRSTLSVHLESDEVGKTMDIAMTLDVNNPGQDVTITLPDTSGAMEVTAADMGLE